MAGPCNRTKLDNAYLEWPEKKRDARMHRGYVCEVGTADGGFATRQEEGEEGKREGGERESGL